MNVLPAQKGIGIKLSTRNIKFVPITQTGCHVVLIELTPRPHLWDTAGEDVAALLLHGRGSIKAPPRVGEGFGEGSDPSVTQAFTKVRYATLTHPTLLRVRTFAITLSQRIEARATGFERMKWARSHSDAVVFKRMGMQVDEAIEITAILTLHPPL